MMLQSNHNPDVLTCIANLSNDEVFTPPEIANAMLDEVEKAWAKSHQNANIWADPTATFLDPSAKSGIFLREITRRLTNGLADVIPDLQARVNHILTKQVYGVSITQLTALLARRSVYCSKSATGKHSICTAFNDDAGNIWFERTDHTWRGGKAALRIDPTTGERVTVRTNRRCSYCGANEAGYIRGDGLETHAYALIHTDDAKRRVEEIFGGKMQFDVVIGYPPYQLGSDGGTRDIPIYQHFVSQAKALDPKLLVMIIPSRWMASGLGLSDFRREMLNDNHISTLVDYQNAADIFPSVGINGGACYFLWDRDHSGKCDVTTVRGGTATGPISRSLNEFDILVRDAQALPILRKVQAGNPPSINAILARDKEFGWTSNFRDFYNTEQDGTIPIHYIQKMKRKVGFIEREKVRKSAHLIDKWKLLVPEVGSGRERERNGTDSVLGPSKLASAPSVCTQSFLFFYAESEEEITSIRSYYATRFFRFLVSLRKITQHATHSTYAWVPMQSWDREWTDKMLYEKYGISEAEIEYIESIIRPMELD